MLFVKLIAFRKDDMTMKPRIFVSSTFYDLKYVREDIANFIKAHDFEPIMFEDGDIGYTPGRALDKSCYETMHSSDMVILIIGGNYGSPSSDDSNSAEDEKFDEYISITHKEFKTAVEEGIPVFTFIESSVYAEYSVYELNKDEILRDKSRFKFSVTKDTKVFSLISEVKGIGNISITDFKKPSEIKDFLGKQWSDMFKNYLKILREKEQDEKTHNSIEELCSSVKEMQVLVNGLFEKTFNSQGEIGYDSLKKEQKYIRARLAAKSIFSKISYRFIDDDTLSLFDIRTLTEKLIKLICEVSDKIEKQNTDKSDICSCFVDSAADNGILIDLLKFTLFNIEYIEELKTDDVFRSLVVEELITLKLDSEY